MEQSRHGRLQSRSKVVEMRERMSLEKQACHRENNMVVMANLEKDSASAHPKVPRLSHLSTKMKGKHKNSNTEMYIKSSLEINKNLSSDNKCSEL